MQNAPLTNSEASDVGIMRCTKGLAQGRSNLSSARDEAVEAAPNSKARLSERQTAQSDGRILWVCGWNKAGFGT